MPSLRKPSPDLLRQVLKTQASLSYNYTFVGATRANGPAPAGFILDQTRELVGRGSGAFERACSTLRGWNQFQLGWLEAFPTDTPLKEGETVIVLARVLGYWWINAARIIYTIDEPASPAVPLARFGFAYGTLPGHVERGEERFLIEWDRQTGEVWYDIRAFSRPRHILTRLGYPLARAMQKRFARESVAVMQRTAATEG